MARPTTIERLSNGLLVRMDDGSRYRGLDTGGDFWLVGNNEEPPPVIPPPAGNRFIWPFSLDLVTSEYGTRNGRLHAGIDFGKGAANAPGSAIIASAAGTVTIANKTNSHGGYGNTVVLDHGGGLCTLYAHMQILPGGGSDVAVNVGDVVVQGQRLGGIGKSGASQGNHLHFETHEGGYKWNASSRNPREFIPKWNAI